MPRRSSTNSNRLSEHSDSLMQQTPIPILGFKESEPEDSIDSGQICPVFSMKFDNATPTYLHGCAKVLAFCSKQGEVRFYSQLSTKMIQELNLRRSYPTCCYMHLKTVAGQQQLYCEIGYNDNFAISYNVYKNVVKEVRFFRAQERPRSIAAPRMANNAKQQQEMSHEEGVHLKKGDVNAMLDIIDQIDESVAVEQQGLKYFDREQTTPVKFTGGVRALCQTDIILSVADDHCLYLFEKCIVSGFEESY